MRLQSLVFVIVLMIGSCATPQEVTRLVPEAPEGHFEVGREYIPLHNDSIDAELGFDGRSGDYLVFDFVVINGSERPLVIDPSEFYYVIIDGPLADSSQLPPRKAVLPESVLHAYDRQMEEHEGRKQINKVFGFIDAGIGILTSASAFAATDNPGYIADAVFRTIGTADHYLEADRAIGAQLQSIDMEREVVREEIFRSLELPPGKVANGFVYFPAMRSPGYLMFCFPMQDRLFQYVYRLE
ncbi:MAG: hypothetical protein ACWGNV_00265 [Bacteroidales bacterium]